jgi:hypothetical protein
MRFNRYVTFHANIRRLKFATSLIGYRQQVNMWQGQGVLLRDPDYLEKIMLHPNQPMKGKINTVC